jgi:hypothetical protein
MNQKRCNRKLTPSHSFCFSAIELQWTDFAFPKETFDIQIQSLDIFERHNQLFIFF